MEITDVRVRRTHKDGKMKAIVSVTFDNELVIHDIKIIQSENDVFIAMPSRKTAEGEFRDVAHPISTHTRKKLQDAILAKYEAVLLEAKFDEVASSIDE